MTFLTRVTNWRFQGPIIRELLQTGHQAITSPSDIMVQIVKQEHTELERAFEGEYYLHYLDRDFIAGVVRVEGAKVTNLAIKERFKNKGHEQRMIDLLKTISPTRQN